MTSEDRDKKAKSNSGGRNRTDETANSSVGRALRTVYQQTVDETIPPEFLDLLGKLD